MKRVGLIYDDIFLRHETEPWHPESKDRLVRIIRDLQSSELWKKLIHISPRPADFEDIARVHDREYIERIRRFGTGHLDSDTSMSEKSLDAALYAAGAVIEAVQKCRDKEIDRAFCAVRPPGHHAEKDRAMGFCLFNNVAVGARYAQKIGYSKVFIIDFDVHHGNGTQHAFEEDDSVYYFSTHQYPHYPGTGSDMERGTGKGKGYTYNATMAAGSGDKDFLRIYHDILPSLIMRFNPDIVLVSAGYDIRTEDPLAAIRVSGEGVRGIVSSILTSSHVPMVFVLEGGYDLPALSDSVRITIEEMFRH
ncbi:MAG: histone deacetylase [Nitrospirales bacterium]|nr:histone deacetylase [Nitrospirales bacterium]